MMITGAMTWHLGAVVGGAVVGGAITGCLRVCGASEVTGGAVAGVVLGDATVGVVEGVGDVAAFTPAFATRMMAAGWAGTVVSGVDVGEISATPETPDEGPAEDGRG